MISAENAMKELALALMYLSRFSDTPRKCPEKVFRAWRNYDFGTVNALEDSGYIIQGNRGTKSITLTREGIAEAKAILERLGVEDWLPPNHQTPQQR